jgi:hypothetical protein
MKNPRKYPALIFLVLLVVISACGEDHEVRSPRTGGSAGELPLLQGDKRIGVIEGFNPSNPPATEKTLTESWRDAVQAGMSVGRLQIDWPELEPSPNTYRKDEFKQELSGMQDQGLQTFLLISAYDSEGPVVPSDLKGKDFDDPELIQRFRDLMDWVIPLLGEYGGYLISISNEADNSFEEVPGLDRQILVFLSEVKEHIRTLDPNMAVTVTIAEGSLDDDTPGIDALLEVCDVACWNFYGAKSRVSSPYFVAQSEDEIRADIRRMLDVSGEKNIVIQELGMYSGNTILNSSRETQRRFFELFFTEMKRTERIKAAYIFQLVDWAPEVTEIFKRLLEEEGVPQDFIDQFSESLETVGLIDYDTGERKQAWHEFVFWLKAFDS